MLEEIVVTARKVQESAQEVPVAITAITTELEQSSIRNLTDLNGYAPNVVINRDGGRSNGANINIRGIS
ncbi:MAG: TonB-dependent receptor plug domain-containing protein, partial [Gammaproteobacteria bacterium]|nr:TonB-dependent receptor plug domain-containing protein [Gammaproteobacteria bacterium]